MVPTTYSNILHLPICQLLLSDTFTRLSAFFMRSAMAREPHFDCADAQVPAADDVLHESEDDLEDAPR